MQLKSFFFALLAMFTLAACHDHHHDDDSVAPVVTILTPTENESVSGEVHMEISITDNSLHALEVKVTKDSDGSVLYSEDLSLHNKKEYDYHEHFTPTVTEETPVTLTVIVEDHNDLTTTKTVKFKVKP